MKLFDIPVDANKNLIPEGGTVNYYGPIMTSLEANQYLKVLLGNIEWRNDEVVVLGKEIITKRKVAWYGDRVLDYTYSNTTKRSLLWTKELLDLKDKIERITNETFNACLLNLYHNGSEGMGWHSDSEKELKKDIAIASVSFGAERKFAFKHRKTKEKVNLILEHGSLLVMKGETQSNWLHSLPPTKLISQPRINLTFRTIQN